MEAPLSLTAHDVRRYFNQAKRHGINTINPYCESCGRGNCGEFATAFREHELSRGHPDPGNICSVCAAIYEKTIGKIISQSVRHDA